MPFLNEIYISIPILQKILSYALLLNICAISAILLAEMDTSIGLLFLILANTIILIVILQSVVRTLDRLGTQLTQISIVLAELTDLIKTQKILLERIEWRS